MGPRFNGEIRSDQVSSDPWGIPIFAAFRWRAGTWTELNELLLPADQVVWDIDTATATTNAGHIVGWGYVAADGLNSHAFLLEPCPPRALFFDGFETGDDSRWRAVGR